MIKVQNLVKRFDTREAVRDVSFEISNGVLGFLGPNGAGKTTTMRMITGYLPPTSGTAEVCGINVVDEPVAARKNMGYLPESSPLYAEMNVQDFLRFIAEIRGLRGAERDRRVDDVIEQTFLSGVRHQTIETLSKGYRQRTGFAQAILHDPKVLIMDEPTDGLDPNQKQVVRNMITQMSRDKVIVLSTHVLEEVEAICSRVIIISNGKLVADSTPRELKAQSKMHHAVSLTVKGDSTALKKSLNGLASVGRVHILEEGSDGVQLRAYPANGQPVIQEVLNLAKNENWPIDQIRQEEGRLDEVFRSLTTTEDVSSETREED